MQHAIEIVSFAVSGRLLVKSALLLVVSYAAYHFCGQLCSIWSAFSVVSFAVCGQLCCVWSATQLTTFVASFAAFGRLLV
jgi:hypothetical protein